jgi:hypothetical protein
MNMMSIAAQIHAGVMTQKSCGRAAMRRVMMTPLLVAAFGQRIGECNA